MAGKDQKPIVKEEGKGKTPRRNMGYLNWQAAVTTAKFVGKSESLEKHIYDIGVTNQTQLFSNTMKEIAEYAGRTLKESQDIRLAIKKLKMLPSRSPLSAQWQLC